MHTDNFFTLTEDLRGLGGRRVWSLMISLFGDLVQDEGQTISGPTLSAIMAALHVKPEAARVALHRLRNDGWIDSDKLGRISRHSLTAKGRAESAAASPRIYATPQLSDGAWQVIVTQGPDDTMDGLGFVQIIPRVYVGGVDLVAPTDALTLPASTVPDWLRQQLAPRTQHAGYRSLRDTLCRIGDTLPDVAQLTPVQISVLRCLIVHNWRRLVLKHPQLPSPLVDPDGPAHQCHIVVAGLLERYPRPDVSTIEQYCAAA
ncbi:PaaX domain protein [Sulfitobacter noctilucicola]|uniref:Phenylacetic acid degradation operon negative regulatory protein n=1 Tax=Sulfitobacter noctilucicola TaxID=1342301 RepID=A0A7W6Q345_9RHOB|nr:PaaX family transcriptional regulator C-terminal domain-containing protein [Sulfitobacter noctilucicola]KIN62748.1 PaaX domain protein [Sulfitobacter noctilucicola]MBB4172719.1 phenylacetic acid degradation operon negative regulatory protein [Sulfitobacter noctilucicola]